MSAGSLLCRVCLAGKVKIYCIEKIGLKEIYEKVTSIKVRLLTLLHSSYLLPNLQESLDSSTVSSNYVAIMG